MGCCVIIRHDGDLMALFNIVRRDVFSLSDFMRVCIQALLRMTTDVIITSFIEARLYALVVCGRYFFRIMVK